MSRYEERLEKDVQKIRRRVERLGNGVLQALRNAIQCVLTLNEELAAETILGDLPINRRFHKLDHRCHVFIARHLPSAGHLRFISGVLRLNTQLERVGDYAETISRASLQLSQPPPARIAKDIEMMSAHSEKILEQALQSFLDRDLDLARGTLAVARQYGPTFDKVFDDMVREGEKGSRPISELFSMLAIFNRLERVIHQAKNVCEQTIFVVTGEMKEGKLFDILFMDEHNSGASQLAEAFARKAYPEGSSFQSASWGEPTAPDPRFIAFAEEKGIDLSPSMESSAFSRIGHRIQEFDIVIDLSGHGRDHLSKIPFHTILLTWKLKNPEDPGDAYEEIVPRLHELIACIRGDEDES